MRTREQLIQRINDLQNEIAREAELIEQGIYSSVHHIEEHQENYTILDNLEWELHQLELASAQELMAAADATTSQTFPVFKFIKRGKNWYSIYTSQNLDDQNLFIQYDINGEYHEDVVTVEEFITNNIERELREHMNIQGGK